MTRRINLLLTILCIFAVAITYILPFIQHDLYTNPSMFDLYAKRHPQLIIPGAVMQGKYYMDILSISSASLIISLGIVFLRNSRASVIFNLFLGLASITIIVIMSLTLQVNHDYHNFSFLSGFYILFFALISKSIIDLLYLRFVFKKR